MLLKKTGLRRADVRAIITSTKFINSWIVLTLNEPTSFLCNKSEKKKQSFGELTLRQAF